jgi:hypothetical protein
MGRRECGTQEAERSALNWLFEMQCPHIAPQLEKLMQHLPQSAALRLREAQQRDEARRMAANFAKLAQAARPARGTNVAGTAMPTALAVLKVDHQIELGRSPVRLDVGDLGIVSKRLGSPSPAYCSLKVMPSRVRCLPSCGHSQASFLERPLLRDLWTEQLAFS